MKIHNLVSLLALFLICGPASTARSDITAFFSAGTGSINPGVYSINAAVPGTAPSLLIPAGGALSLTNPDGLAFLPNAGTNLVGTGNYSLLVSSYGTNTIDAYNLTGSAEGIFADGVPTPGRMFVGGFATQNQYFAGPYVFAIAGAGVSPRSVVDRISLAGSVVGSNTPDPTGNTADWTVGDGGFSSPLIGLTTHGVNRIQGYSDTIDNSGGGFIVNNLASQPHSFALGPFNVLYVGLGLSVEKFSPNGTDLGRVLSLDPTSSYRVQDVGFGPDGKLYVLEQDSIVRVNVAVGTPQVEQTNYFPTGTAANTLLMSPNTFPGGVLTLAIEIQLMKNVLINFAQPLKTTVTPGVTGVVALDSATLHAMPSIPGVTLFNAVNMFTTAQIGGSLPLEFQIDPTMIPPGYSEGQLKLYAYDPATGWQDITGFRNFDSNTISGTANSFETFAIGAATVPEPSSFVLGACGFVGLATWGWRWRKRSD
jgi:hypothetical protein